MPIAFRKYFLLVLFNFIIPYGFGQTYDYIKVIVGKGVVFNSDSILLNKTTIKQTCDILKIKDITNNGDLIFSTWDGYDAETLEMTGGTELIKKVPYKNIEFEFASAIEKDNLKLRWIRMKADKSMKIYCDNGLIMNAINPDILGLFPKVDKVDYISENGLTFNLYSYGMSFKLIRLDNNDLQLIEISVHYKSDL